MPVLWEGDDVSDLNAEWLKEIVRQLGPKVFSKLNRFPWRDHGSGSHCGNLICPCMKEMG